MTPATLVRVPVFYSADVSVLIESFSPSAGKPRLAVAAWTAAGLPIELREIDPVVPADLHAVHDPGYVDAVLAGKAKDGFGGCDVEVARSFRYTSGAMVGAARHALACGVACAPVSGFHHAGYRRGGGFCTFNGLMLAAVKLLGDGAARRVLIVDADMHYGDGTDDIIRDLGLGGRVDNVTFGRWYGAPRDAAEYLARLEQTVARFGDFDLILYSPTSTSTTSSAASCRPPRCSPATASCSRARARPDAPWPGTSRAATRNRLAR